MLDSSVLPRASVHRGLLLIIRILLLDRIILSEHVGPPGRVLSNDNDSDESKSASEGLDPVHGCVAGLGDVD